MRTQPVLIAALVLIAMVIASVCAAPAPTAAPPTAIPAPSPTTAAMLKPDSKIGEMIVKTGTSKTQGPPLWAFCSPAFGNSGVTTTRCDVPPLPEIAIGHGWFAADAALHDSNWKAIT